MTTCRSAKRSKPVQAGAQQDRDTWRITFDRNSPKRKETVNRGWTTSWRGTTHRRREGSLAKTQLSLRLSGSELLSISTSMHTPATTLFVLSTPQGKP